MGFSWAVHICNQCWVRVIPPKLWAIPPKLRAIPPKSADIFFDFIGTSIQQSILPKLVYNDGIPPKAVFKSEIWKFCRNPKSAKTSIHLELSGKVLCEYSRYRLPFTKLIFDAYMGKVGRTSVFKISVQFLVLKQSAFQWRGKRKAMTVTLWKVNVFPESERQDGHSEMIPNTWPFQKLFLAGRLLIKALPKRAVCLKGSFFVENASCSCSKHHAVCAFNNANLCMQRTCKRN